MRLRRSDGFLRVTNLDWRWAICAVAYVGMAAVSIPMQRQGIGWIICIPWAVACLCVTAYSVMRFEWSDFRFDTMAGEVYWKRWTPVSHSCGTFPLADIEGVNVEWSRAACNDYDAYRLVLQTRSGDVPMTKGMIGVVFSGRKFCEARSAVLKLLGREAPRLDEQAVVELMRAGKLEKAIALVRSAQCVSTWQAHRYIKRLVADQRRIKGDGIQR